MPRSNAFHALDIRVGQREFLNVVRRREGRRDRWQLVTFDTDDFDPGFDLELGDGQSHDIDLAIFADNVAVTQTLRIAIADDRSDIRVELLTP